jgi:hypothetical protein
VVQKGRAVENGVEHVPNSSVSTGGSTIREPWVSLDM